MVKHQRRSHQRGVHSSELEDGETSDSDCEESPSTPQHSSQMQWPQTASISSNPGISHGHQLHRAHSFADFGQGHLDGFSAQQTYGQRHSVSGGAHHFSQSIPEHYLPHQTPMLHRAPSLPAHPSYYTPEQNYPGVATLNTNPHIQTYHLPRHRSSQEMLQSSPSTYSSASRASPVSQEAYYTHQPAQAATYALQNIAPIEQQPGQYEQQQQQQQQLALHMSRPQSIQTLAPQVIQVQDQYHPTSQQDGHWYDQVPNQAPVQVITHVQAYPQQQIFQAPWKNDPWKIETYDDPSLQMPSARVENL